MARLTVAQHNAIIERVREVAVLTRQTPPFSESRMLLIRVANDVRNGESYATICGYLDKAEQIAHDEMEVSP
ncbi:hypothetical protein GCM10012275_28770 [Longimycelium tulufanense]|uniref:Uncharacterized protein n=1 Tax=Longimycelium tulufanense TaxID=907463 RepID=A0A8J3FUK6_9PSEU|nr:hypothetical protein [Longimycelium tulufanense]GGM55878.1 hypothetical protein GCM10012275_28770 [Longimycelium tulufanense]